MNILDTITVREGYYNTDQTAYPDGAMAVGSYNVLLTNANTLRAFKGMTSSGTGGRAMFTLANGYGALKDNGSTAYGSIFNFINESLWFSGNGDVLFNGTDTSFNASSSLQLSPKSGGTYTTAYTAGLAQPNAPSISAKTAGVGFTGLLTGLYSFKIARVRSVTGARSIASATSNLITCTSQTARLTFPALDANGQDRWAIFATKAGFGGRGVHYLVEEIADTALSTIDGVARSYEIEFTDADLLPTTAYIDDYPPPSTIFSARLENYVLAIGCYENAIAVSLRNFPESFNPEHLGFLPEAPTAVLQEQLGNYLYVATEQSVHAVSVSFAENPLVIQTIWANVGIKHAHNWCSANGVLYAFVAKQGFVTMGVDGQPSNQIAVPVAKEMKDWTVDATSVYYDPNTSTVIVCNGLTALAYNTQTNKWSSPVNLSSWATGNVVSGCVYDRQLKLTVLNGSTFSLFNWDVNGGGSTSYRIVSPDKILNIGKRFTILGMKAGYQHSNLGTVTFSCFTDFDSLASKTFTNAGNIGFNTTKQTRWFLPRKEAVRFQFDATQTDFSKDSYLGYIVVFGADDESNIY
jgi:hypothetical protein